MLLQLQSSLGCLKVALLASAMLIPAVSSGISAAKADVLDLVKQRGALKCGVNGVLPGFSSRNERGVWTGFDVDFCRAVAAAIFGDGKKVTYVPLTVADRFEALRKKKVDLVSRNSTWTMQRETTYQLLFAGITYHDGQGLLVMGKPNVTSALELGGSSICVQKATTSQQNLSDFFRANSMKYTEVLVNNLREAIKNLESGKCDVFSADQSALFAEMPKLKKSTDARILPDIISKEPLGPLVRADDIAWFNLVRWVSFALINAEELGIGKETIDEALKSKKPSVRRFAGLEGNLGKALGLEKDWAINAVRATGNYAEIFRRNVGADSKLGIPRGLNQLWSRGGILYAPPLQ